MTPEIKFRFRIRRKENGVEDISFFYFTLDMILDEIDEWEILSVDRFSGLTDMNKKEIYENDIIVPHHTKVLDFASRIIFRHGCFGYIHSKYSDFVPLGRNGYYFDLRNGNHVSHALIIIGNAHEDPELVKEVEKWMK